MAPQTSDRPIEVEALWKWEEEMATEETDLDRLEEFHHSGSLGPQHPNVVFPVAAREVCHLGRTVLSPSIHTTQNMVPMPPRLLHRFLRVELDLHLQTISGIRE